MINQDFPFELVPKLKINFNELKHGKYHSRKLMDMASYFSDITAVNIELANNPLIYEFWEFSHTISNIGLNYSLTSICAGKIGREFFMTKGHSHRPLSNEAYITLSGKGLLLLQKGKKIMIEKMTPGHLYSIPGGWAHRTVNTNLKPLIFFSIWAKGVKHNYKHVEDYDFEKIVLKDKRGYTLVNRS